ncbi:MAG: hypothetical protein QOC98_780, partial [Frankiaceae bacterium]|nr:hypothetical protein [Frankiaceae bacterium]
SSGRGGNDSGETRDEHEEAEQQTGDRRPQKAGGTG